MANVIFKFGTSAQYALIQPKDENTLYWLTDTQELYRGEALFGVGKIATAKASGLLSAEDKAALDKLIAGDASSLSPADASISIADGNDGKNICVQISERAGNALSLNEDGLFAQAAMVVKSGSLETVDRENVPYDGAAVGDPYLDILLGDDAQTHIYIPVKELVDEYKPGDGVEINDHVVGVKIDKENANGLAVSEGGISLAVATHELAGALSAVDKKVIDSVPAVYDRVKYEFVGLLDGCRTDINGKEIRVMFPKNAPFVKPTGEAEGRDNNSYYFGIKVFAPSDDVVGFKESLSEVITDEELEHFDGPSSGIDKYGRKYDICWYPAAKYSDESQSWIYHGDNSEAGRYVGWYHTIEWYDANNKVVGSETVRINLSNENCHNSLKQYLGKDNTVGLVWEEM